MPSTRVAPCKTIALSPVARQGPNGANRPALSACRGMQVTGGGTTQCLKHVVHECTREGRAKSGAYHAARTAGCGACTHPRYASATSKRCSVKPLLPSLPPMACRGRCRCLCRRRRRGRRLASPARPRHVVSAVVTASRTGAWMDLHSSGMGALQMFELFSSVHTRGTAGSKMARQPAGSGAGRSGGAPAGAPQRLARRQGEPAGLCPHSARPPRNLWHRRLQAVPASQEGPSRKAAGQATKQQDQAGVGVLHSTGQERGWRYQSGTGAHVVQARGHAIRADKF